MYLPKHFQVSDPGVLKSFMKENSFATLVSNGAEGLNANHYPFLSMEEDGKTVLFFHLARANQQWKELQTNPDCLVIFTGPHDYISPTLYKNPLNAPTWNYTAVHATCTATLLQDKQQESKLMDTLVNVYESKQKAPWPNQLPEDYREKLMKAIVWVRLEVTKLEGKFKLSQNRELADYEGVLTGLQDKDHLHYMHLTRPLKFERVGPEASSEVQTLLETRPDYQEKVAALPFTCREAEEALTATPPGFNIESKYCYLIYHGKEALAFVDVLRGYPDTSTAYIGLLLVRPGSKGLGLSVYTQLERIVQEWGEITTLRLGVATTNKVFGFWEIMGFETFGPEKDCSVPGVRAREMKKELRRERSTASSTGG